MRDYEIVSTDSHLEVPPDSWRPFVDPDSRSSAQGVSDHEIDDERLMPGKENPVPLGLNFAAGAWLREPQGVGALHCRRARRRAQHRAARRGAARARGQGPPRRRQLPRASHLASSTELTPRNELASIHRRYTWRTDASCMVRYAADQPPSEAMTAPLRLAPSSEDRNEIEAGDLLGLREPLAERERRHERVRPPTRPSGSRSSGRWWWRRRRGRSRCSAGPRGP